MSSKSEIPVFVHRGYGLPRWALNKQTLLIASSHSGNTEETLSAYNAALEAGCPILGITTGGKLANLSRENKTPVWVFQHIGQPRAAVGFSFALVLSVFTKLGLIDNPEKELIQAIKTMEKQIELIQAPIPIAKNPAKRLAGQMVGRWVTIIGSGLLAPVARRWKTQINEIAKAWAQFEELPEMNHNTLAGTQNPESMLFQTMVVFLNAPTDSPRNRLRSELTQRAFMIEGMGTDMYIAKGESELENLWTAVQFGDYVSYYLAMAYDVNPTPVDAIENFKKEMAIAERAKS